MAYPQITEYQEAVQHPAHAFIDPDLKQAIWFLIFLAVLIVRYGGGRLSFRVAR